MIDSLALFPILKVGPVPSRCRRFIPLLVVEHVRLVEPLQYALLIQDALLHNQLRVQSQQVGYSYALGIRSFAVAAINRVFVLGLRYLGLNG